MITYTWKEGDSTYAMILPDGSPDYNELLEENRRLLAENAKLVGEVSKLKVMNQNHELWSAMEDVCCSKRPD